MEDSAMEQDIGHDGGPRRRSSLSPSSPRSGSTTPRTTHTQPSTPTYTPSRNTVDHTVGQPYYQQPYHQQQYHQQPYHQQPYSSVAPWNPLPLIRSDGIQVFGPENPFRPPWSFRVSPSPGGPYTKISAVFASCSEKTVISYSAATKLGLRKIGFFPLEKCISTPFGKVTIGMYASGVYLYAPNVGVPLHSTAYNIPILPFDMEGTDMIIGGSMIKKYCHRFEAFKDQYLNCIDDLMDQRYAGSSCTAPSLAAIGGARYGMSMGNHGFGASLGPLDGSPHYADQTVQEQHVDSTRVSSSAHSAASASMQTITENTSLLTGPLPSGVCSPSEIPTRSQGQHNRPAEYYHHQNLDSSPPQSGPPRYYPCP